MKILLDTVVFLQIISGSSSLSKKSLDLFSDSHNDIYLSVISIWEIILKYKLGKLPLPESPDIMITDQARRHDISILPLDEQSVYRLLKIPLYHNDPFDRMLVCQALNHRMTILTPDKYIRKYKANVIW